MRYGLYVKISGRWQKLTDFEVSDAAEAFGQATARLPREHYDKPMALRPLNDGPSMLIEPIAGNGSGRGG